MTSRYFFFKTLMDTDVLQLVLGRPVTFGTLPPAWLHGCRRMRILHDSFPVLVADPSAAVDGLVFTAAGPQDQARILFFEDYDYDLATCRPVLGDDSTVEALFYGAAEGVSASD